MDYYFLKQDGNRFKIKGDFKRRTNLADGHFVRIPQGIYIVHAKFGPKDHQVDASLFMFIIYHLQF